MSNLASEAASDGLLQSPTASSKAFCKGARKGKKEGVTGKHVATYFYLLRVKHTNIPVRLPAGPVPGKCHLALPRPRYSQSPGR